MLNFATTREPGAARALKELYKSVLDTIVSLVENGDGREPPATVRNTHRSRTLAWRLSGVRGPACRECGCDGLTYEPEGEGMAFDFCPACWSMRGEDRAREASFDVGRQLEKRVRDLPPGMTLSLNLGGRKLPLGPSGAPASPGAEEQERYRSAARTPLEIGRQIWMGRITFEGMNGVPEDHREARRWFERAERWGRAEALSMLGVMALNGFGGPRDRAKAVEFCRQAAERGYVKAETGMGRFLWDGVACRRTGRRPWRGGSGPCGARTPRRSSGSATR
jgi:hypothetical protein